MTTDADRQNALAGALLAAELLHRLRALEADVGGLLESAIRAAATAGVSQAIIGEAVDLTPGRISQIVSSGRPEPGWSERLNEIVEWPGDALREYRDFPGRMTYPPYPRRRKADPAQEER